MKTKIATAFEQIEKKTKIDTLVGKLHTIMSAAIQENRFSFFYDVISGQFDELVNSFSDEKPE